MTLSWLMTTALINAALATLLALVALVISRLVRSPALTHLLWVVVLLKLLTPPLIHVPIAWKLAILPERGAGAARASDLTDHSQFPSNTSAVAVPVAGSLSPTAATTSGFRETAQRTSSSLSRRDLPIPEPPVRRRPLAATLNSYSNFAIACLRAIWLSG